VAIATRWYGIGRANYVVWDEAHFAKFANYYLTNRFYTDLHPNLGKGLLGLSGWLAGSPGHKTFEFKSEQTYPPEIPYVWMRRFCAFFGALMVPLAYGTGKAMGMTRRGALFAGLLVLFGTFCFMGIDLGR
jgi:dolichyl-phosphate-mannose-protein mannosyltransferase